MTKPDRVHYYLDDQGEIRWRRTAAGNHEPLGHAGEGFTTLAAAETNARRVNGGEYDETYDEAL